MALLSLLVSVLALVASSVTAWLTLLRGGKVLMTQPTVIYFGPDGDKKSNGVPDKIFLRTSLYSTGKKGNVIENMFVRLRHGETQQNFNIWASGERHFSRGSGLFVPETSVSYNHHFLLPHGASFRFLSGRYRLEVFISAVGQSLPKLIHAAELDIPDFIHKDFEQPGHGLYFDWGPEAGRYFLHVRPPPAAEVPPFLGVMCCVRA